MAESCWVASAVWVSVEAAASSSVEAEETESTMLPTAAWNLSARPSMTVFFSASARAAIFSCSRRSRLLSFMLSTNTCTASAMLPISSRRSRAGIVTSKSPCAMRLIACGDPHDRAGNAADRQGTKPDSRRTTAATIDGGEQRFAAASSFSLARAISRSRLRCWSRSCRRSAFRSAAKLRSAPLMNISAEPASPSAISIAFFACFTIAGDRGLQLFESLRGFGLARCDRLRRPSASPGIVGERSRSPWRSVLTFLLVAFVGGGGGETIEAGLRRPHRGREVRRRPPLCCTGPDISASTAAWFARKRHATHRRRARPGQDQKRRREQDFPAKAGDC